MNDQRMPILHVKVQLGLPQVAYYIFYASRQHLRSAAGQQLVIPSHRLTTYGQSDDPSYTAAVFRRSLKTFLGVLVYTVHQRHLQRCAI